MKRVEKRTLVRMCVACREHRDKAELLRVAKNAAGELLPDKSGKAEGRGAYVCATADCLQKAYKRRGLERAFSMAVPPEVYEALVTALGVSCKLER